MSESNWKDIVENYKELWEGAQQDSTELLEHLIALIKSYSSDPTHIHYDMKYNYEWLKNMNWWREEDNE